MTDLIKVYVTSTQREYLEFLVNRRLNELGLKEGGTKTEEYKQLEPLKKELQHAGT